MKSLGLLGAQFRKKSLSGPGPLKRDPFGNTEIENRNNKVVNFQGFSGVATFFRGTIFFLQGISGTFSGVILLQGYFRGFQGFQGSVDTLV